MVASWLGLAAIASFLMAAPIACAATSAGLFAVIYPDESNVAEYRRKDRKATVAWLAWLAIVAAAMACDACGW